MRELESKFFVSWYTQNVIFVVPSRILVSIPRSPLRETSPFLLIPRISQDLSLSNRDFFLLTPREIALVIHPRGLCFWVGVSPYGRRLSISHDPSLSLTGERPSEMERRRQKASIRRPLSFFTRLNRRLHSSRRQFITFIFWVPYCLFHQLNEVHRIKSTHWMIHDSVPNEKFRL